MDLAPQNDLDLTPPDGQPPPAPDPKEPLEPRVPPSEPADAWALDRARKELAAMRERAAKAEESANAAASRAKELEASLAQTRAAADSAERGRHIDQELFESGAIDLETTRLLAEAAVAKADAPDVAQVVRELRRRKPFLFRGAGIGVPTAARFADHSSPHASDSIDDVSEEARVSGDRMAILRYLRLKRGV